MLHMLSTEHKKAFLQIARLLNLSDNDLVIKKGQEEEKLCNSELESVSFLEVESENSILQGFMRECGKMDETEASEAPSDVNHIGKALLTELGNGVLKKHLNDPEQRLRSASLILKNILSGSGLTVTADNEAKEPLEIEEASFHDYNTPSIAKIMLYELILMAMADGDISDIEWSLIRKFADYTGVEGFILDDLRERAEATNIEATKTLALILE